MKIGPVKSSSEERGAICLFLLVLFVGTTLSIYYSRWNDIKGSYFLNTNSLITTSGTIISSQTTLGSPRSSGLLYEIKYKYIVKGKMFISNKITFKNVGDINHSFAISYVNKYPVGRHVTVYYDHINPSFAVLEPEEKGTYIGMMLSPFILGMLFVLSAWYYLKKCLSN